MNIIVFIKQVPDTETRIRIGAGAKNIDEADVSWIISPYDEFALEEALKIKEARGAGKVTVVSAGPERVSASLRNALAMGADAKAFTEALEKGRADLPKLRTAISSNLAVSAALKAAATPAVTPNDVVGASVGADGAITLYYHRM